MAFQALPSLSGYAVRRSGAKRAPKTGMTQSAAWNEARRLARDANAKAYLFGANGRIVTRADYGTDR